MPAIILPHQWREQPRGPAEINHAHPLGDSLVGAFSPLGGDISRDLVEGASISWSTTPSNYAIQRARNVGGSLAFDLGQAPNYYSGFSSTLSNAPSSELTVFYRGRPNTTDGALVAGTICRVGSIIYTFSAISGNNAKQRLTVSGVADYDADGFYIPNTGDYIAHGFAYKSGGQARLYSGSKRVFEVSASGTASGAFTASRTDGAGTASQFSDLILLFKRQLSDAEWMGLEEAPWEVFRPLMRKIYSLPSGPITLNSLTMSNITSSGARATLSLTR